MDFSKFFYISLLILSLGACSGGGGNGADNNAPTITSSATVTVEENTIVVMTITAADADNDSLTYSLSGGADQSVFSINATTGALSFITAPDYEAHADANGDDVYEVQVSVSDGFTTTTQDISVTVTDANDAPVFTSTATPSVIENTTTTVVTVMATDANGDSLTYSLNGGTDQSAFSINTTTGALRFITLPDYEVPTDANSDNLYEVQVAASDGVATATQDISVAVTNVNDNAPIITSEATLNAVENTTAVVTVSAFDADGDSLTYSVSGGADNSAFSINATTGALSFTSAPDYETATDTNTDNIYEVQVAASDGVYTATQDISVAVDNANDNAPVIISPATLSVVENTTTVVTVSASDADGDSLFYSIIGGADQSTFSINSATGVLSFTAAPDYEAYADSNNDNVYEVQVTASDGVASATQDITVTLTDLVIAVNAELNTHQPLDGTWSWCNDHDPGQDSLNRHFFTDNNFVMESYVFESTDGSCTGQAMVTSHWKALVTTLDNMVTSGWVDSSGTTVTAPANQGATGFLANNPTVTKLSMAMGLTTPPGPSGDQNYFYYVDDTGSTHLSMLLYRPGGTDANLDGYLDYVSIEEPLGREDGTITPLATLINAESGSMQLLDGYWRRDCTNTSETGNIDTIEELVFAAGTLTGNMRTYTSTDGSCSTGEEVTQDVAATGFVAGDNFVTSGWVESDGTPASAPLAQSGSGLLTDPPTVTILTGTQTYPSGPTEVSGYFYMDDTATTWCLYVSNDAPGSDVDGDGISDYVYSQEPYCKVSLP